MQDQTKIIFMPLETAVDEIRKAVATEFQRAENERKRLEGERIYTINAVSKKLGRNFQTIKKYCKAGLIRTVPGGGIPESAIIEFLNNSRK
ncbi:MAG: hypothetical protein NTX43_06285 [Bacteroidetes bacterium]|jgi:tryptophanyl-tRNA synthetase|nr:hypothetical protein [Bacteroidota bacterium]